MIRAAKPVKLLLRCAPSCRAVAAGQAAQFLHSHSAAGSVRRIGSQSRPPSKELRAILDDADENADEEKKDSSSGVESEMLPTSLADTLTPEEIVAELDKHVIGQKDAKKAVALALRNRWRRRLLNKELRSEGKQNLQPHLRCAR